MSARLQRCAGQKTESWSLCVVVCHRDITKHERMHGQLQQSTHGMHMPMHRLHCGVWASASVVQSTRQNQGRPPGQLQVTTLLRARVVQRR